MIELYEFLTLKITEITPNVGFKRVTSNTKYPYVIYDVANAIPLSEGDREDIIIEIDIWHKETSGKDAVVEIEALTKQIQNVLKKERYLNGSTFFLFELINRLHVPDEDEAIHRRQLRFRVRSYA